MRSQQTIQQLSISRVHEGWAGRQVILVMIISRYNSPHIPLDTVVTTCREAESSPTQGEVPHRNSKLHNHMCAAALLSNRNEIY